MLYFEVNAEANEIPDEPYEEISDTRGLEEPFKYICNMERMRRDRNQSFLMRQLVYDGNELEELAKSEMSS